MKKQLQKFFAKKKNNKGFTLIELIIVIAILAILVSIVGVASIRYVEKSRKSADEQTLDSVSTAVQAAVIDPEHQVTLKDGTDTLVLEQKGDIGTLSGFIFNNSAYPEAKFKDEVIADMAKTPKLNSQHYKNGAKLTLTVSGTDIKVTGWEAQ